MCVSTVADSSSNWAVCGKSSGMVLMPVAARATHKVQIEVMPLFAGHLPFPKIKVLKYMPHTAAVAIQPDPGKTPKSETTDLCRCILVREHILPATKGDASFFYFSVMSHGM